MRKISVKVKPAVCLLLCIAVIIAFLCTAFVKKTDGAAQEKSFIKIWQIDSFEGGKGSRADYLKKAGNSFTSVTGCYVSVVCLSAEAARVNLAEGNLPDLISYGAGTYGIENYIDGYSVWCHGGYCFITLDENSDFSDINSDNTIVNEGRDNLAGAAALMCGLQSAVREKSTGAYVKLINGNYKYLLGTQRDIYRLKTRGVSFSVKPVTQFNDLYQNISCIADGENAAYARRFTEYLLSVSEKVTAVGMLSDKAVYDDEMKAMSGQNYEYKLVTPVSEKTSVQLKDIISRNDINMLKNLLK